MYKVKDIIVYKKDVCVIKEIKEKYYRDKDYYIMHPIDDESLIIQTPIDSKFIRKAISKDEAMNLIAKIPSIDIIDTCDKMIESEYRTLLNSGNLEDLVKIIKTTYLRNNERLESGKKAGEKDSTYFKKSERYLYNELAVSLDIKSDEVRDFIVKKIEKK